MKNELGVEIMGKLLFQLIIPKQVVINKSQAYTKFYIEN